MGACNNSTEGIFTGALTNLRISRWNVCDIYMP